MKNLVSRMFLLVALAPAAGNATVTAQGGAEKPAGRVEASTSDTKWKPEDVVMTETASQFRVSPDGMWAVWVKKAPDKEKDAYVSNLFLTSLTEKKEIQLTRGAETHAQPRWSPSGEFIAFLSNRPLPKPTPEARAQLWLINAFGGEPYPLTESERGVKSFRWLDNDTIAFSAEEDPTLYEREIKRKKDQTRVVDDVAHTPPVRLFKVAVKDKKVTRLTQNDDFIENWDLSPDGRRAAAVHAQYLSYEWDHRIPPRVVLHDLATGGEQQIFPGGRIRPLFLRWAADGSGVYALAPHTTHATYFTAFITVVYFHELAAGSSAPVDLGWENGLGADVEPSASFQATRDGFLALLADGVRYRPARYTRAGATWTRAFIEGEHARNISAWAVTSDAAQIVYEYSTASLPPQWYRAPLEGGRLGSPAKLTELNPQLKNKTFAKTEVIRWKGALDEEVEGILYYPHNYEPGKRYPLVVAPHGGPASADVDSWDDGWGYPANLFSQRGAFFFKPNYHGSGNYGLKWVESICCGKYYDLEIPDIEKGVDSLIAQGKVDPERIGALGWSNGSILSIQLLVSNPARYKVAAVGAGNVEYVSDWANSYFGHSFDSYYFGKSLLEDPSVFVRKSPLLEMEKVRAPTLIFFGAEDRTVHPSQGWTHYRSLYHLAKVPVRFMLFPGEDHVPQKLTHRLRKVEEEQAWFERYLFKTEKAANEALKEDSPLADALKRKSIRRAGPEPSGRYGVAFTAAGSRRAASPVLIPEVVRRGELEIGRFEVTREQYAAFDSNYAFAPGTENYPANGITNENAKAYAAWLSKLTGQTWRLPNEDEVAALYEKREGENTLDYWAGYAVNPDDAERLMKNAAELGGPAPLLKEVGSFRGSGGEAEELLFDLGGNVAEWVLTKDSSRKTFGGSADRPADSKGGDRAASLAYSGFRVVRGAPSARPSS